MLRVNSSTDPIVEILRLAYRRGIALRQEQEKIESLNSERNGPDRQIWINTEHQSKVQTTESRESLS